MTGQPHPVGRLAALITAGVRAEVACEYLRLLRCGVSPARAVIVARGAAPRSPLPVAVQSERRRIVAGRRARSDPPTVRE